MYRTILVPLDGSKRAEAILSHVELIAEQNKSTVVFLKVEDEPISLHRDEVIDMAEYHAMFERQKARSQSYLATIQSRLSEKDIQTDIRLVYGPVVKSILETASEIDADLIAMATHGWSGLTRVSYGSVAAGVLQAAELPILLIRSGNDFDADNL